MESLRLRCPARDKDLLIAELSELGTLGIAEEDSPDGWSTLEAYFERRFDTARWPSYQSEWKAHDPAAAAAWQRHWEPVTVGERFFLVPDWRDDPAPPGRLRLVVHAGQASGSGYSTPTQLVLRALEEVLRPEDRFLDAGTGSGILCEAARLLGARRIAACDIDPVAVAEARRFKAPAQLWIGSPRSVRAASFDVVAANLNGHTLHSLHKELARVLAPGGRLVICGFKPHWRDLLVQAFGLPVAGSVAAEGYCALTLQAAGAGTA